MLNHSLDTERATENLASAAPRRPYCIALSYCRHLGGVMQLPRPRLLWLVATAAVAISLPAFSQPLTFEHHIIDPANPSDPHCKTLGDIDGDGFLDALAASSSGGGMYWYEYPSWTKHPIRASGSWTTDMQTADIDDDGDPDVVIPNSSGLQWYENPRPAGDPRTDIWVEHLVGAGGANHHDVEVADIEGDGDLDIVTRTKAGGDSFLWRHESPLSWTRIAVSTADGEGTSLGDLDGDGDLDVAHNGFWVEQVNTTTWLSHTIDSHWAGDVAVVITDIDGNGDLDVVLAPSESSGRMSWYEAADPVNGPWTEHSIDATVSYMHTFKAGDMDGDGDLDLVTAEMHQSSDPDEVSVYRNDGGALAWTQVVIATSGSHNLRIGDIGSDGDLDVYGANWNDSAPNSAVIEMWDNQLQGGILALDQWQRHIVETSLPWQAVFVDGRDLNGDGLPDIVTGGWWYPNPGTLGGAWTRQTIGAPLSNMAAVHDFDNDGDLDILGTNGQVSGEDIRWAQNDGSGVFAILDITNSAMGGDFLQGVSVGQVVAGGTEEVLLSWHNGASGTSMFSIPADPTTAAWPLSQISPTTNQEQIPIGDLDGDLDIDVHLGTDWLRQDTPGSFSTQTGVSLSSGVPDRVVLADIDQDTDLDVVIGVEFGQLLVWGENVSQGASWTEHTIASDVDYFSVDAADMDGDGDVDVVGGAHQGNGEVFLYENDGSGTSWTTHTVDPGDSSVIDHHDGTQIVDMDLDGDLDIISVGWSKRSLVVYENLAVTLGDVEAPVIDSVFSLGDPHRVTVVFSERVDPVTSQQAGNFAVSGGIIVSAALLEGDGRTVTLTTSELSEAVTYTLTVNAVEDLAGNVTMPDTEVDFAHVPGDPTTGLVAYWPFNEGFGTATVDASGNGRHGTLVNGPEWTT
ncbi:MAG: VCBS repeat-containing protein [Deltaproteobacteria bacterium]|nr:VCBS repeat-containing protein [Deltaproteobacteria bacterium]